jgi:Zn finger protein HypA/HybF involved in hydrogenase expression
VLHIDEVPLSVMCGHCQAVKTPSGLYNFRCPDCGRPTPKVLTGREMQLVSIELVAPSAEHISAGAGNSVPAQAPGSAT